MVRFVIVASALAVFGVAGMVGCDGELAPSELPGGGAGGVGNNAGGDGSGATTSGGGFDPGGGGGGSIGQGGNGFCGSDLTGVIRDFHPSHPDFENELGVDQGFIAQQLGADAKPVYIGGSGTATTHGQANFDQWFRDVPSVNLAIGFTLNLTEGADGVYTFDSSAFFPIDDQGFGNESNAHNYHFTFELHTKFIYNGGEVFQFTGDDDLFTFIDHGLVIDLGGVHGAMSAQIALDTLGLTLGQIYDLDLFFAERHTTESNFRIDTTIAFTDCGPEDPT